MSFWQFCDSDSNSCLEQGKKESSSEIQGGNSMKELKEHLKGYQKPKSPTLIPPRKSLKSNSFIKDCENEKDSGKGLRNKNSGQTVKKTFSQSISLQSSSETNFQMFRKRFEKKQVRGSFQSPSSKKNSYSIQVNYLSPIHKDDEEKENNFFKANMKKEAISERRPEELACDQNNCEDQRPFLLLSNWSVLLEKEPKMEKTGTLIYNKGLNLSSGDFTPKSDKVIPQYSSSAKDYFSEAQIYHSHLFKSNN